MRVILLSICGNRNCEKKNKRWEEMGQVSEIWNFETRFTMALLASNNFYLPKFYVHKLISLFVKDIPVRIYTLLCFFLVMCFTFVFILVITKHVLIVRKHIIETFFLSFNLVYFLYRLSLSIKCTIKGTINSLMTPFSPCKYNHVCRWRHFYSDRANLRIFLLCVLTKYQNNLISL